ncbi:MULTISPECIES: acetyl-CoA carboxylase biotin carboxyl carrier protein subunit [Marinilabiliaceae]|uniref:Biotin-requiring enzyme n=2 Tax=Marinilabiliaceae TaxID=558415 RepID=A0A1T5HFX3_9BACT|nr:MULTISPECIES: acetyl-CoA carboxylase biotin carboxyl carrier protein subunit [Marinilabiliaceae]ASB48102.1 acetyl-CoA carboxylase biotin carboxyl carrier protein subunit [Alkalitalea saponilacus]TCO07662.1 biotin-dependent enzyme [Natronoflexus pectinivorans]SKC19534.1 Biotin-requiring enzyme [Alkalitalea saponilacus]
MEDKKLELVDFAVTARKYKTLLTIKYATRKPYKAPDPKEIKSYIPGTIIDIKVKPGAKVKEGQILLILEAMKMMNKVLMPFDGKIKNIHVSKGEKIPKNHLMIELE